MEKKSEYRSSVRSREKIRAAFVELMHKKGTTDIKVMELAELADVNRSTFYAHYQGTYEVLDEIENEVIMKLFKFLNTFSHEDLINDPMPLLLKIGTELEENKKFYKLLIETKGSLDFINKLKYIFLDRKNFDKNVFSKIKRQQEFSICMNFIAGGTASLLADWTTGKVDIPMKELMAIISDTFVNAVKQYI